MDTPQTEPKKQTRPGVQKPESDADAKMVQKWLKRLQRETEAHRSFRDSAKAAMKEFERGENSSQTGTSEDNDVREPIYWANTTVTAGAVFARQPKPDVRRRWTDGQADKRLAIVIERSLSYQQDNTGFSDHSNRSVIEFLAAGLGQTRVYLETEVEEQPAVNEVTGELIKDDAGQTVMKPVVTSQRAPIEYVPWDLFRWEPVKDWEDCTWVSFDKYMSADQIEREYRVELAEGDKHASAGTQSDDKRKPGNGQYGALHLVHRIWDKKRREVYAICSTLSDKSRRLLDTKPDPFGLKDFFPCPRPMMMNLRSGKLCPKPDYHYISGKCQEIDRLSKRIKGLVDQIVHRGFYDSEFSSEMGRLNSESDGALIPVNDLLGRFKDSSLNSVVITEDIREKAEVVVQLVAERERAKASLFELTGISDIIRAATKASETATAQQLKSQWANVRLSAKMREISAHFRNVFRIQSELIAEKFEPEQLTAQTGVQVTKDMMKVLRSDSARCYAIDVESDSMIAQDEAEERQGRIEFANMVTDFAAKAMPMATQGVISTDFANTVLKFVAGSFKHGREIEDVLEKMPSTQQQVQQVQQQAQEAQGQVQQMQQQMQQMQADSQKQLAEQAKKTAEAEQRVMELEQQLQAAQGKGDSPTKQMRDMAAARKDDATAAKTQAETALAIQQATMIGVQPGMV